MMNYSSIRKHLLYRKNVQFDLLAFGGCASFLQMRCQPFTAAINAQCFSGCYFANPLGKYQGIMGVSQHLFCFMTIICSQSAQTRNYTNSKTTPLLPRQCETSVIGGSSVRKTSVSENFHYKQLPLQESF